MRPSGRGSGTHGFIDEFREAFLDAETGTNRLGERGPLAFNSVQRIERLEHGAIIFLAAGLLR